MVRLLRVAQLYPGQFCRRQFSFQAQNRSRGLLCTRLVIAGQREHLLDMQYVLLANVLEPRLVAQIVIAVGQAHAGYFELCNHVGGRMGVLLGRQPHRCVDAVALQLHNLAPQAFAILDRVNPGKFRLQRLQPQRVDVCLVHAGTIEVSDELICRTRSRCFHRRGCLEQGVQSAQRLLLRYRPARPPRLDCGHGMFRPPRPICIGVKVVTGIDVVIDVRHLRALRSAVLRHHHATQ